MMSVGDCCAHAKLENLTKEGRLPGRDNICDLEDDETKIEGKRISSQGSSICQTLRGESILYWKILEVI